MVTNEIMPNSLEILLKSIEGQHLAIIDECGETSYGELIVLIQKMAGFYLSRGLPPKTRIMIMLPDSVMWVAAYLGAIWAGLIPVAVNPEVEQADLTSMCELAAPCFIVTNSVKQHSNLNSCLPEGVISVDIVDDVKWLWQLPIDACESAQVYSGDDELLWVFTSGSLGQPKALTHSMKAIEHSIRFAREVLKIGASDRLYSSSRLFFAYPLANFLFAAIGCGATMILHQTWPNCEKMLSVIEVYRPTIVFSVPALYRQFLRQAQIEDLVTHNSVRRFVSAGEDLTSDIMDKWRQKIGIPLLNGFGMSETLSFVLYRDMQKDEGMQVAPGVSIYSIHDEPRRLCFSHPGLYQRCLTKGQEKRGAKIYFGDDLFKEVAPKRWLFQGRADFLTKINGRFVHTLDEETYLRIEGADFLEDVAVICLPDGEGEMQIIWCVVANNQLSLSLIEQNLLHLKNALPKYRQPSLWRYYETLPRTSTGKLLYRRLLALAS